MKHAYLIIAHNEFDVLGKLISMLDHPNNDIYLHIDKKVKDFDFRKLRDSVRNAHIVFTRRIRVTWGEDSQIKAELILLEEAAKTYHDYYHLLSGVDLPIKTHEEIDRFFEQNAGAEFVDYYAEANVTRDFLYRVQYYSIPTRFLPKPLAKRDRPVLRRFQKMCGIDRFRHGAIPVDQFRKGSNWFDITHGLAEYILCEMKKPEIGRAFRYSFCGDEVFVQTLVYRSGFYRNVSGRSTRFVDWHAHQNRPETLTMDHWNALRQSDRLFARKFSGTADQEVIGKVYETWK